MRIRAIWLMIAFIILMVNAVPGWARNAPSTGPWTVRWGIAPLRIGLYQPDYNDINEINNYLGIRGFDRETLITFGGTVFVEPVDWLRIGMTFEQGRVEQYGIRDGVYREIEVELDQGLVELAAIGELHSVELHAGLQLGLMDLGIRTMRQPVSGEPLSRPLEGLENRYIVLGALAGAGYWFNPHLGLHLSARYSAGDRYEGEPGLSTVEGRNLGAIRFQAWGLAISTAIRF